MIELWHALQAVEHAELIARYIPAAVTLACLYPAYVAWEYSR